VLSSVAATSKIEDAYYSPENMPLKEI
jgi:hypothetical protein